MSDARPDNISQNSPRAVVTYGLIAVVLSLHLIVSFFPVRHSDNPEQETHRRLGALVVQQHEESDELRGPYDLWAGQWWRVPVSSLHHAGWQSLFLHIVVLLCWARPLEQLWGSRRFLLAIAGAASVAALPNLLRVLSRSDPGPMAWGMAPVMFAVLGMLAVVRRDFSPRPLPMATLIVWGVGVLMISRFVEWHDRNFLLPRLTGLAYGCAAGAILRHGTMDRIAAFLALHVVAISGYRQLAAPTNNAHYECWLAEQTDDVEEKRERYRRAMEIAPRLGQPATWLAEDWLEAGQPHKAWNVLIRMSEWQFDDPRLGVRVWEEFTTSEDRAQAYQSLQDDFGQDPDTRLTTLISQSQRAEFYLDQERIPQAWTAVCEGLRDGWSMCYPPENYGKTLGAEIWSRFTSVGDRQQALTTMDDVLGLKRRRWHLELIPRESLIPHYLRIGESRWAWQTALDELVDHPHSEDARGTLLRTWRELPVEAWREAARADVERAFFPHGLEWKLRLGILSEAERKKYRPDQQVMLPELPLDNDRTDDAPRVDEHSPHSAVLGDAL